MEEVPGENTYDYDPSRHLNPDGTLKNKKTDRLAQKARLDEEIQRAANDILLPIKISPGEPRSPRGVYGQTEDPADNAQAAIENSIALSKKKG